MYGHIIAAVFVALIMLGGIFAIARNTVIFLVDTLHGNAGKAWYNRPYLFRGLAWFFTLTWLFGPYTSLGLDTTQQQIMAFALYIVVAASWLWVLRVSFMDGIPQRQFKLGPAWGIRLGWSGHATITYLFQLLSAAGIGVLFVLLGANRLLGLNPTDPSSKPLFFLVVLPFLIIIGLMSMWRVSLLMGGVTHTPIEAVQHIIGGREAGPAHTPTDATTESSGPSQPSES